MCCHFTLLFPLRYVSIYLFAFGIIAVLTLWFRVSADSVVLSLFRVFVMFIIVYFALVCSMFLVQIAMPIFLLYLLFR